MPLAITVNYGLEHNMPESLMCKKYHIEHKMYAQEFDVQKVLYTAQYVRLRSNSFGIGLIRLEYLGIANIMQELITNGTMNKIILDYTSSELELDSE